MGWVRLELEILASARMVAPLSDAAEARFDRLRRRERVLVALDDGLGRSEGRKGH